MLNDTNKDILITKLDTLQESVNIIAETLQKMQRDKIALGGWVSEKETMTITGLSRSTLLKLRRDRKLGCSTLSGKQLFYRLSDFKKLLDKNEFEL